MSFSVDVAKFRDKAMRETERLRRAVCVELFRSIILDTPVDMGRARGNWQTTTGPANRGVIDRLDKSGAATINEMRSNLGKGDVTVTMTNNLPYIRALEYGHSSKRPEGMVRINIARVRANLLRKKLSV